MLLKVLACFLLLATISAKHYSINSELQIQEVSEKHLHRLQDSIAVANYTDSHLTSGWAHINVETSGNYPDSNQTYSAGYLEGYLTYDLIWATNSNKGIALLEKGFERMPKKAAEFIHNQTAWINQMAKENPTDNYWNLVNATISQLYGLYDGYISAINHFNKTDFMISFDDFYTTITYSVDLPDVVSKYSILDLHLPRCSFLLKLTENGLFTGHTTWSDYTDMVRLYKIYNFNLQNPLVKNKKVSFSSIPGAVASEDDFYIVDGNKVVAETTLVAYDPLVYSYLHSDSVPYWIRVTIANQMFTDQKSWADAYFTHRSGTYNNQWLIVDFNNYQKYKSNLTQAKDIIWMVEEFYKLTSTIDVTQELLIKQGYVASYNSPYNETIWALSKNIDHYAKNPRGKLFEKYAPEIKTFEDFQAVLRKNNHSDTNLYCLAIASRCDLQDTLSLPFGAIDCKTTTDTMVPNHQAWILNGPSTYDDLPPFNWTEWPRFNKKLVNMPNVFNFNWTFVDPTAQSRKPGLEFLSW